ncbi:CLUMA_CG017646, isoform A [Clunio marinus]|uniref:cysteine--tRNA ligase n=1 Tax=Clunio marinus TaxID=568069 RepID=A0A1J1J146_9DIPT|nr:CLUMA_CG017646, isoform A [Clunio marinus]
MFIYRLIKNNNRFPMNSLFSSTRRFCHKVELGVNIYNSKLKRKVPLILRNPLYSSWYTCGPTVYDSAHIGHACTFVRLDIIQRILRSHFNVNLVTCMNITNIDDKIIQKGNETGRSWKVIAEEYEQEFWQDLNSLNIIPPDIKLRVTDKIPEILKFIEGIEAKGFTKVGKDNSVYFKISNYNNYGKLQNISQDNSSTDVDFALWKSEKPNEPSWDSKWGKGRPGWHIECSTLASLVFGKNLDFHAGGIDLKFPHHENEEAQSCVYHSVDDWVSNWIHTGHLHLEGQKDKMSKSLKNTVSIREFLQDNSSDQFRVAILLSHYRNLIEFGPELMKTAEMFLNRIKSFREDSTAFINGLKPNGSIDVAELTITFEKSRKEIDYFLRDDFNTSRALGQIVELINTTNKMVNSHSEIKETSDSEKTIVQGIVNYVNEILNTFGVGQGEPTFSSTNVKMENLINSIIKVRNDIRLKAREEKNKEMYKICDSIRDTLEENSVIVKDHGNVSSWNYIKNKQ